MKKILVVSYYPVSDSGSMNLWTKDKVSELLKLGNEIILITSPFQITSSLKRTKHICKTYYVYSLNPSTFWREYSQVKSNYGLLILPLVYSLGLIHEIFERAVLKRIGHGMWGWTMPSLFIMSLFIIKNKYDLILSLGGPSSSHLATTIASKVFKVPSIIEFQDPIVGTDIGHNSKSAKYFELLEKFLVRNCSKIVYVTRQSAKECKERFPHSKNITYTYSSSSLINLSNIQTNIKTNNLSTLSIAYFGEVYSTRNYNSLFLAFKNIKDITTYNLVFELSHYGNNPNLKLDDVDFNLNFKPMNVLSRDAAMIKALEYDLLLLIQHTDERSKLTIPYKTWDYLNTQKPILALLNNDELRDLLDGLGHYTCDVNDVDSIVAAILRFHNDLKENRINITPNPYEISKQVCELISL